jgi:hypothetical protein
MGKILVLPFESGFQGTRGIAGFGLGFAIKHLSYQYAFLCFAFVFLIMLLPVYVYIIKRYGKDPRFAL